MPHIHTEPGQHDLTTTAFIIRRDTTNNYGLLHVHKKLDVLLPVGGHIELYETPWAGILHEIEEESGYEMHQLRVMQPPVRVRSMDGVKTHPNPLFLQTHAFKGMDNHSHIDIGFLFVTNELPSHLPADGESTNLLWLTHEQIQARSTEMPPDIAQIYDFCFTSALEAWDSVSVSDYDR
jgi:8-oxo-dGTP diphosphatase